MPRINDFRVQTFTAENLMRAFDRLYAELSYATGWPATTWDYPVWTGAHLGGDINTAIAKVDAAINAAATLRARPTPANATRVENFTTGAHDVRRLHAELDRLHGRITALSLRSIGNSITPSSPFILARTGSKSYINLAGTLSTATDGQAAFGLPYVTRRNLLFSSQGFNSVNWALDGGATVEYNQLADPFGNFSGTATVTRGNLANSAYGPSIYQNIACSPDGNTFTFSIYVRSLSGTVDFKIYTGDWNTANYASSIKTATTAWQRFTFTCSGPFSATGITTVGVYITNVGAKVAIWGGQLDLGSTATLYQPTNASGVDLTNPLNGAGLVLEGASKNLWPTRANAEGDAGSFYTWAGVAPSVSIDTTNQYQGSGCIKINSAGATTCGYYDTITYVTGQQYTFSVYAKTVVPGAQIYFFCGAAGGYIAKDIPNTGQWTRITHTYTATSSMVAESHVFAVIIPAGGGIVYLDAGMVEVGPFATSWVDSLQTRNADICGIVYPHNLLRYSEQLDNAVWSKVACSVTANAAAGPDGTITADRIVSVTPSARVEQTVAINAGKTYTLSRWLAKAGTASPKMWIAWLNAAGGTISDTTSLPVASATGIRDALTGAPPAGAVSAVIRVFSSDQTSLQDADVCQVQFNEGSMPGPYVRTADTAIPAPAGGWTWPQNIAIEFGAVIPGYGPVNGTVANIFGMDPGPSSGATPWGPRLYIDPTTGNVFLQVCMADGSAGAYGGVRFHTISVATAVTAGIRYGWRIELLNYSLNGVRKMLVNLYKDGSLIATVDLAALYGATAYAFPSQLMVSNGYTYATLSAPSNGQMISYPPLPAGAMAAT